MEKVKARIYTPYDVNSAINLQDLKHAKMEFLGCLPTLRNDIHDDTAGVNVITSGDTEDFAWCAPGAVQQCET